VRVNGAQHKVLMAGIAVCYICW